MRYMNLLNDLTIDCKNNGGCYRVKDQLKKVKYLSLIPQHFDLN